MTPSGRRRFLLLASLAWPLASVAGTPEAAARERLREIEREWDVRLGLYALDTASGAVLAYREDERFAFCSTFKLVLCAAVLALAPRLDGGLERRVRYGRDALVSYSPITEKHVGEGLSVGALCAAAMQYSDNTAANLLIDLVGGTQAVTAYARRLGDIEFRLDRWETELNSALPGDPRDTTTPRAMGRSLQALTLGSALDEAARMQLRTWMRGNTTGATRIRAGVPADWQVEDKTGGGNYGVANDVGLLVPPGRRPLVLAIYTSRDEKTAAPRSEAIAAAARVVADWAG